MRESKNWCITDFDLLDWGKIFEEKQDIIRYLAWGRETCPKSKKVHMQVWMQLHKKKTFGGVKRLVGNKKIHLEACRGDEHDNDIYCKKDGSYQCKGEFVVQGQRTDLEGIKTMIDEGKQMKEIADENFEAYCKYHRAFDKYEQMVIQEKTRGFRKVKVIVHCGDTGTNKTRTAVESSNSYYKIQGDDLQWFDGYKQEKTLIIDEYSNQVNITKLLGLLDGYQLRLPVKGGFTYANWENVYITTNLRKLHENAKKEHQDALNRRITSVVSTFKENDVEQLGEKLCNFRRRGSGVILAQNPDIGDMLY